MSATARRLLFLIALACCTSGSDEGGNSRSSGGTGRDTILIDVGAPACATCSLAMADSLRLGGSNDAEIPQRVPKAILRDSRGTYYLVFNGWVNKPILRYDSLGKFIGKLGAFGDGPGEYRMTSDAFIGPGDSILVGADNDQLFSPDGAYARSLSSSIRRIFGAALDGSGDVYSYSSVPPIAGMDLPPALAARMGNAPRVFREGPDGVVRDSFPIFTIRIGRNSAVRGWVESRADSRPFLAPDGTIWTVLGARLEQHASNGAPKRLIGLQFPGLPAPVMTEHAADSLLEIARATPASQTVRPPVSGRRTDFQIDADGLVWITHIVEAPRADTISVKMDYLSPNEAPGEGTVPANVADRLKHTIVEVVDPARSEVLARTELPFAGFQMRPGFVGRVRTDAMDRYIVTVYRLALERQ